MRQKKISVLLILIMILNMFMISEGIALNNSNQVLIQNMNGSYQGYMDAVKKGKNNTESGCYYSAS